jgi:DNA-binding response OmpR family regulator
MPPYAVLIVEDDADLREMMCELLEADGFDTQSANDGDRTR